MDLAPIVSALYGDTANFSLATLLRDIDFDIGDAPNASYDIQNMLQSHLEFNRQLVINIDIRTILRICDKLVLVNAMDKTIKLSIGLKTPLTIVNHRIRSSADIYVAYMNRYNIVFNGIVDFTGQSTAKMVASNKNVNTYMRVAKLYNTNWSCTTMHIGSLRVLYASDGSSICDATINLCVVLEELYADNNKNITTCKPFANTLHTLSCAGSCGITDKGIKRCAKLKNLHMMDNVHITTCVPFARTLKYLNISNSPYNDYDDIMCDDGLYSRMQQFNISELNANYNRRITTCKTFAKSLKILHACCNIPSNKNGYNCGIGDYGLRLCTSITELYARHNYGITTCAPFAHSLRKLSIPFGSGIRNEGLRLCMSITDLNVSCNPRAISCDPFANTLRILDVSWRIHRITHGMVYYKSCGTGDEELRLCRSLTYLDARDNRRITNKDKYMMKPSPQQHVPMLMRKRIKA